MEQMFGVIHGETLGPVLEKGGPRRLEIGLVERNGLLRDKSVGLELTHPDVTELMVTLALSEGFVAERVLDPAAGFGNFLYEVGHQARDAREFIGYEPNAWSAAIARERLAALPSRSISVEIHETDALSAVVPRAQFDLVLCNPPYVRIQRLQESRSELKRRYATATGRFDLYFLFFELAARALKRGGRLAFITSNKYMTTNSGRALREMLTGSFAPIRVIDFRDASPFRAAVLSSIVVLEKGRTYVPGAALAIELSRTKLASAAVPVSRLADAVLPKVVEVPRLGASSYSALTSSLPIGTWSPSGRTWHLGAGSDSTLLDALTGNTRRLDHYFPRLSVGIKTTADDVFVAPFDRLSAEGVESTLLHPLVRGGSVVRWRTAWDPSNGYDKYVLYPHRRSPSGRTVPVDLDEYPGAKAFLESHRSRLESRQYVLDGGRQWFEIWVPQKVDVLAASRKLVFPDFAIRNTFAVDWSGVYVGASAAFAVPDPSLSDSDLWYVLYLLNSPLYEFIHQRFLGTSILSKRHRYWTRHVASYPIPWPTDRIRSVLAGQAQRAAECGIEPEEHLSGALSAFTFEDGTHAKVSAAVKSWIDQWRAA